MIWTVLVVGIALTMVALMVLMVLLGAVEPEMARRPASSKKPARPKIPEMDQRQSETRDAIEKALFDEIETQLQSSLLIDVNLKRSECIALLSDLMKKGVDPNDLVPAFLEKIKATPHTYLSHSGKFESYIHPEKFESSIRSGAPQPMRRTSTASVQ